MGAALLLHQCLRHNACLLDLLDVGFTKLESHELDFRMMFTALSSPVRRPGTGLHTDEHWGAVGDQGHQGMEGEALVQDDLAPLVHPDNGKDPLCDVNTQYAHRVFHWTRACGCMVSLVLKSFWLSEAGPHRGRVHFITTS
jgi:hypothetical protein